MLKMLLFALAIFSFVEAVSYLIYRQKSFEGLKNFYTSILKRRQKVRDDIRTFTLRYDEHPFLALSSNPEFRNSLGEKIHNKYGFRHRGEFEDIDRSRELVVYATGGSSTYCNFIEKNEKTWPGMLETRLNTDLGRNGSRVINAACSGWTSFQSLIRFSAWVDVIKPDLVIVYHGKNDLAPFANSDLAIDDIHPDYGNVMYSLKFDSIAKGLPLLARYTYTGKVFCGAYVNRRYFNVLWRIYNQSGPTPKENIMKGLSRIGPREWEYLISRYRTFASICKDRNIACLFVLQKVVSDMYTPYVDEINRRLKLMEDTSAGVYVYDFAGELKDTEGILYDSVHFTERGADVAAGMIKDYIVKNIPAFKDRTAARREHREERVGT